MERGGYYHGSRNCSSSNGQGQQPVQHGKGFKQHYDYEADATQARRSGNRRLGVATGEV